MLYVQQQYFLHAHRSMLWMYWQKQVGTTAAAARQNTLTLPCTLPCLRELLFFDGTLPTFKC